jgi:hypothetical protein
LFYWGRQRKRRDGRGEEVAKTPKNHNKPWTPAEVKQLKKLANGNTPTGLIAHDLKRTKAAVQGKASAIGQSLKPVNKSPYNRRKKAK